MNNNRRVFVVHVYKSSYASVGQPPGFADFILGTISLHHLSTRYSFQLRLDLSDHPLAKCLKGEHPSFAQDYNDCMDCGFHEFFNDRRDHVESHIQELIDTTEGDVFITLTCHTLPTEEMMASDQLRQFMREAFQPSDRVHTRFIEAMGMLGLCPHRYVVLHVRSGDRFRVYSCEQHAKGIIDEVIQLMDTWLPSLTGPVLVVSDSHDVKMGICSKKEGYVCTPFFPGHMGSQAYFTSSSACDSVDRDKMVEDTFLEWLFITQCREVYGYNVYGSMSNFAACPARFFNIDWTCLRHIHLKRSLPQT